MYREHLNRTNVICTTGYKGEKKSLKIPKMC